MLPGGDLTVIANTADDDEFWGLLVCPDVDAVIYRLAGEFNETAGYGQKDETFNALDALRAMGEKTWFRIGDKDLATHVLRAEMLRRGATLTEASLELCRRFSLKSRVVPMSDDPVRTRFSRRTHHASTCRPSWKARAGCSRRRPRPSSSGRRSTMGAVDTPQRESKGKKKGKQAAATGSAWQLASGEAATEEGAAEEVRAPNSAMAIAQYAVLVVGLVMVLIGVLVMVANSKVT